MKASLLHLSVPEDCSFRCWHRIEPTFQFQWHFHPEHQIELLIRGQARQFAGDRVIDVRSGELVLLGAYLPHTLVTDLQARAGRGEQESVMVQFHEGCMGPGFFELPELRLVRQLLQRGRTGLLFSRGHCRPLAQRLRHMPRQAAFERLHSLLWVLQELAEVDDPLYLASDGFEPSIAHTDYERINTVCRFVNEHLAEPLTEHQIGELVYLGPSAFSRFFRRVTGRTFVDYVSALRIALACKLLTETGKPILDICFEVGFGNKSNFNRQFKRRRGTTPQRFRDDHRGIVRTSRLL